MDHTTIKKAIIKSQHCQRNWDLSKEISQDDMDLLLHAATECPSKQNIAFYKVHMITNRDIIEKIHSMTTFISRHPNPEYRIGTNPQVLANLLIVLEKNDYEPALWNDIPRNNETDAIINGTVTPEQQSYLDRDAEMAVGVAAGYLNLTASILGLRTGCCACFDPVGIKELLGLKNDPLLLMGIGYKDDSKNRRVHHQNSEIVFSTKAKQPIPVNYIR